MKTYDKRDNVQDVYDDLMEQVKKEDDPCVKWGETAIRFDRDTEEFTIENEDIVACGAEILPIPDANALDLNQEGGVWILTLFGKV